MLKSLKKIHHTASNNSASYLNMLRRVINPIKHYEFSPYLYGMNNLLRFVDENGMYDI